MNDLFAALFEFFGTLPVTPVRNDLFNFMYIPAGFALLLATFVWTVLFYQGFILWRQRARFDTVLSWLVWMLISAFMTTLIVWIITISTFQNEGKDYTTSDYLDFLCMVFFWSLVLYFLYSIPLRYSNPARRKVPFRL